MRSGTVAHEALAVREGHRLSTAMALELDQHSLDVSANRLRSDVEALGNRPDPLTVCKETEDFTLARRQLFGPRGGARVGRR